MKKYLSILCAAMLCACCLALGACASGGSSSAAASSASASASASESSSAADPAEQFVGTWKFAAAESQGITMSGDLSALLGTDTSMAFTLEAGGTGSATFAEETAAITWEVTGDNAISIKAADEAASSSAAAASSEAASASSETASSEAASASAEAAEATDLDADSFTATATLEDDALKIVMGEGAEQATLILTKDGTYADAKTIDASAATPITSEDALVGSYTLTGMNMMGISMYGPAEALSAMAGGTDMTVTFEKGGKVDFMGSEATFTVGADGAAIVEGEAQVPVKALGDDIAIDMSEFLGMQMVMVFSK
ncbi:MAG: hypothetical protein IJ111_00740 [Eggerthellaceae bacterium]|nr:hypothetical protein [Eggerthellaceae bacterium]